MIGPPLFTDSRFFYRATNTASVLSVVQRLAAALCLPGDLAACAAWAVIVAHHTTRAPMVKLTSNSIVAEDPNVFEIADVI